MGASKFLQKKANTRAKEIDKKYGEGQYGGTWWQDMVKNNAEMGESPSESFLQRKMKEINSARTVKPESTQDVVSGSGAQKDKKSFLQRAGLTVSGGAKGSLAGNMDAMGVAYELGQSGRTQRYTEELREAQWAVARAKHDYDADPNNWQTKDALDTAIAKMKGFADTLGKGAYEQALTAAYDAASKFETGDLKALYNGLGVVDPEQGTGVQQQAASAARDLAYGVQESASKDLQEAKEGASKFGQMLVDAGASMTQMGIDSAVSGLMGFRPTKWNGGNKILQEALGVGEKVMTPGAMIPFAARAFGGSTMDARQDGADLKGQVLYGGAQAAKEVFTEKMFNIALPFAKAYGKGGLDSVVENGIRKAAEKLGKSDVGRAALERVMKFGASAASEGLEEFLGDFFEWQMPRIYGGDTDSFAETFSNALYDFAVGTISGAAGGAVEGGVDLYNDHAQARETKKIFGDQAQDIVNKSKELAPDNKLAEKYQKKLDKGGKLTGFQLMRIMQQNKNGIVEQDKQKIQTAAEARLTELGETENVPQVAEAIARQAAGERITDAEKTLLEGSERARQVRQELNPENIRVGATDEEWTGQIGTARVNRAAYNRGIQENGVTGAKYNAETGKLDAIVKDDQGKIKTVPAEKAELSPLQEELFDWATDLGEAGPVLVSAYRQTQNLETYARQFHNAFEYGKAGVPMDYVNKSQAVSYLNTTQREIAYEEGAKAHQRDLQGRQEKKRSGGTVDSSTQKKPTVSLRGATVGGVTYAPVNKKAMDGRQWASVGTMKAFAQATGVNVVFYESQANERGEYEGANGFYKNGTLYLDINAGRDRVAMGETAILKTAAHEITHYIKEGSPEQYEVLKNFVVEKLTREKGLSIDDLVTDKQRREPGLSYEEAVDEVVADACEMMLKDSKAVEQLARENRSLAERIRQWIRKWVRSLKAAMEGLTADRPESRAMMQYARELQEIWDNALVDAVRNGRGTMREAAPAENRQSIRETSDGKKYVKADRQVLFGSDPDSWSEQLEDYINGKIRRGQDVQLIAEDGDVILLTSTSAGKLSDNHTSDGRTMSDAAFERKANAAAHIDELVEVSSKGKKTVIDKDARHGDMASGGWNYRTAYFMDFDGKYYKTTISVAEGAGGSIVYNVGKMQERSTPQFGGSSGKTGALRGNASDERSSTRRTLHADDTQSARGGESNAQPSVDSIRQSNDNSQENSSDKVQNQQRDYSYEALTSKPDMQVTMVDDTANYAAGSEARKNVIARAIAAAKKVGSTNENGNAVIHVDDMDTNVILSAKGLRHGLDRRFSVNAPVTLKAGEILKNAIRINELTPKKDTIDASYVLIGAAKNVKNEPYIVQFVVNRASNEVTSVDVLHSIGAKKEPAALLPEVTGVPATLTGSTISISGLLDYVNRYFPDVLPESVLKHYGHDARPAGELGANAIFQQREIRLSDRAVLLWAAEKAMSERSKRWSIEDLNRFDILVKKLKGLDEAYAELKALKEERTVQLAGRKESELKNEERFELNQTKNRIQTQKDKIQRLEADTYRIESIPQMKELLRKSRSIVEAEAAYKARREYIERREEQEMMAVTRRKVERNAKRLTEYMTTNTDKKHIPEALKKPIGELLESLDFSAKKSGRTTRADLKYIEAMQDLQAALAAQRLFDDTGEGTDLFKGYMDLPAGFESLLAVHVEKVKNALEKHPLKTGLVRAMDIDDLKELDVILSVMSRSVTRMNEMFVNRRFALVSEAAENSIDTMSELGQHQDKTGERFMLWDNTLPWYAFQRFGEGGKAVFEGLQDGWDKLAFNMKTVLDFRKDLIKDALARKWDTEKHRVELTDPDGVTVTAVLTTAQLMSLHCLSKRKQALGHLLGGGIRPSAIELTDSIGDRIKKRSLNQDKQFKLTEESLAHLLGLLTPEQVKIADAMQKFMTEQGSLWGNEVTMIRFGYRGFTEQNYFPIETDAQDRQAKTGDTKDGSLYRLQNISAVKPLVKNANNALVLRGIFDVFANHTADMAKYNALVLPILDAQKWYNYKYASKNEAGQVSTRTVQRAMTKAYGGAANNYVIKYLQDLNGVKESGDRGDTWPKKMISNYKRAMVAANMRVALLQPTAYARASAVLDYEYLAKAFADKTSTKQATAEMLQYSGIALWKSFGFFDTDVGRSIRDQIKGKSSKLENIVDKTMVPAEKGDEITWARLWRACKMEVQDKQKLTGDELLKATAERFREVVYRTQVVDSTMTRSHTMRSNGTLSKMATSFMSEPTVSYNMVMESTRQTVGDAKRMGMRVAIRRNWKALGRSLQAYVMSAAVTAIVESLYDALRDPDDDEYMEKVWKAFGGEKPETAKDQVLSIIFGLNGNFAGGINPIGKVPYLRDVVSILGGYSSGRMDTEAAANLKKAIDIWDEVIRLKTGDLDKATKTTYYGNMTTYGMIYPTAKALSQLTGLPGSAAMREVATAWNTTVGTVWPALKMRTYEDKKLREAWENYGKDSGVSYAVMYRAIQDLKEFESDRDADGNAISGSLKAKYVEYIRGMGLTTAQEKAVWEAAKNSSWSDKGTPWG